MNFDNKFALDREQSATLMEYADDILDNLSGEAISELLGGNEKDLDSLISDIYQGVYEIVYGNNNRPKVFGGLDNFENEFEESMRRLNLNYFISACLPNFTIGWRILEWSNLVQRYPWSGYLAARGHGKSYFFAFALPIWRMYRYSQPNYLQKDTWDNKNSRNTTIVTFEQKLAKLHIEKIVSEIKANDILLEKMDINSNKKADLGKEGVTIPSGANLKIRTYGSQIRGLHEGMFIVDDFLNDNCLYSHEQNQKFIDIFIGSIIPAVEPYGYLIVSGTPFVDTDLYSYIKAQKGRFKVFEYPCVFPDGSLLSPDRFTFDQLMETQKEMGSIRFSREMMVKPVSDASSLFPWKFLERSFVGMENIDFANNLESFPIKLKRVVLGCDFAMSGSIGADYSAFMVWGMDESDNFYLLNYWRERGKSPLEQVNQIVNLNSRFKPNKIVCESNGFQQIMSDMVRQRGLRNVEEFVTTSKVKKGYDGLPSISAMFERGEIRMPYKEGTTRERTRFVCGEFASVTYNEDKSKLESSAGHDDTVMGSFFAITDLREQKGGFKIHMI